MRAELVGPLLRVGGARGLVRARATSSRPSSPGPRAGSRPRRADGRLFGGGPGRDTDAVLEALRPVLEDPDHPEVRPEPEVRPARARVPRRRGPGRRLRHDGRGLVRRPGRPRPQPRRDGAAAPRHPQDPDLRPHRQGQEPDHDGRGAGARGRALRLRGRRRHAAPAPPHRARARGAGGRRPLPRRRDAARPRARAHGAPRHPGRRRPARDLSRRSSSSARPRPKRESTSSAGEEFNIRSNANLGRILFEKLELHKLLGRKRPKRTAKGTGYATDEQTLLELAPHHDLPGARCSSTAR